MNGSPAIPGILEKPVMQKTERSEQTAKGTEIKQEVE